MRSLVRAVYYLSVFFVLVQPAVAEKPVINIVYPKLGAAIAAVDSTFILGSVTPGSVLRINRIKVNVHSGGGFIAFLPIRPGVFTFSMVAELRGDTAQLSWPVNVPMPRKTPGFDSLYIMPEEEIPGNLTLARGDRLTIQFQGTPGCIAYFSIPGLVDSIPMVELPPQTQLYWGEALFGAGAVPESLKIRGYYKGFLDVEDRRLRDSSRICYHLVAPSAAMLREKLRTNPAEASNLGLHALVKLRHRAIIDSSSYFVRMNPADYPRVVEFTDSVQIIRVGPRKGYLTIFQPKGVTALAVGAEGEWVKLKLSQTQYGWVSSGSVHFLEVGRPPVISYLRTIRTFSKPENLVVELPLSAKHPFRVEESSERSLTLYIYGVDSETDWIRYDFNDKILEIATWAQAEPELYRLDLKFTEPVWGYDVFYEGNILKLQINKHPQLIDLLKDKRVVIDPGHSDDPGAIGPTGLKESEANLWIAQSVKKELERKGANVVMTRTGMSNLPLNERPAIAKINNADIFVSIHNNALPDGVNPFVNNGVSTYYYHPHSINLARAIQTEMLKETELKDYGLYYGNLAVDRPTQYPAVLVECAFIILPEQEAMLKTEEFRSHVARAIRAGIEDFLSNYGK